MWEVRENFVVVEKETIVSICKYRVGDIVECVRTGSSPHLTCGQRYEVMGTSSTGTHIEVQYTGEESGRSSFHASFFKLSELTTCARDLVTGGHYNQVVVCFNSHHKEYTYHCDIPGVMAGNYVIVPDRQTAFKYAIVRVVRVARDSVGASVVVIDKVDTSEYEAQEVREEQQRRLRQQTRRLECIRMQIKVQTRAIEKETKKREKIRDRLCDEASRLEAELGSF